MTAAVVALVVLAIVCVGVGIAIVAGRRPARVAVAEQRPDILDVAPVRSPVAVAAVAPAAPAPPDVIPPLVEEIVVPAESPMTWTSPLTTATLDEEARLRLIDDLVLLRASWAVETLRRAYEEEHAPHVRERIEAALAACGQTIESGA